LEPDLTIPRDDLVKNDPIDEISSILLNSELLGDKYLSPEQKQKKNDSTINYKRMSTT